MLVDTPAAGAPDLPSYAWISWHKLMWILMSAGLVCGPVLHEAVSSPTHLDEVRDCHVLHGARWQGSQQLPGPQQAAQLLLVLQLLPGQGSLHVRGAR
jgi:hypothetical protein